MGRKWHTHDEGQRHYTLREAAWLSRFPSVVMDNVRMVMRYHGFARLAQALSWAAFGYWRCPRD